MKPGAGIVLKTLTAKQLLVKMYSIRTRDSLCTNATRETGCKPDPAEVMKCMQAGQISSSSFSL